MGEKSNFAAVSSVINDKPERRKNDSALSSLSFLSVSSGFYILTFSLISALFTIIAGIIFYFTVIETVKTTEILINKYANDTLSIVSASIQDAIKTSRYAAVNRVVNELIDNQGVDAENKMIQEIFYLDKKGSVHIHTDLTKVTNSANTTINKVSSIYNNELFHTALMMSAGEINKQPYPYDTYNKNRSYLYLIRYILPRDYFDTMDYSMPIYVGKKSMGTFHVVLNRVYADALLQKYMLNLGIIWAGSILAAVLISLIIKIPIGIRLGRLKIFISEYLTEDINHYIEKAEKHKIREEIDYIDHKIAEMVKKGVHTSVSPGAKQENIKDAYLIREH